MINYCCGIFHALSRCQVSEMCTLYKKVDHCKIMFFDQMFFFSSLVLRNHTFAKAPEIGRRNVPSIYLQLLFSRRACLYMLKTIKILIDRFATNECAQFTRLKVFTKSQSRIRCCLSEVAADPRLKHFVLWKLYCLLHRKSQESCSQNGFTLLILLNLAFYSVVLLMVSSIQTATVLWLRVLNIDFDTKCCQ